MAYLCIIIDYFSSPCSIGPSITDSSTEVVNVIGKLSFYFKISPLDGDRLNVTLAAYMYMSL